MNKERKQRLAQLEYDRYMGACQFWTNDKWDEYNHLVSLNEGYIEIEELYGILTGQEEVQDDEPLYIEN